MWGITDLPYQHFYYNYSFTVSIGHREIGRERDKQLLASWRPAPAAMPCGMTSDGVYLSEKVLDPKVRAGKEESLGKGGKVNKRGRSKVSQHEEW